MVTTRPYNVRDYRVTHVVIEIFAGDNNLSDFILEDMQEMAAGNTGPFSVLALADFADDGAYVVELSPRTGNRVIHQPGEIDTGDPDVIADFLARALVTYPGDVKKAIGFWDHGSGIFDEYDPFEKRGGSARDPATMMEGRLSGLARQGRSRSVPARRLFLPRTVAAMDSRKRAMLHDDTDGGVLTNYEARNVLRRAFDEANYTEKVDIIFSDTCLNGMIEVTEQFREFAHCVVASEDLEPGDGWEYHEWFYRMSLDHPRSPRMWARQAVDAFEAGYAQRRRAHPCTLGAFETENAIAARFACLLEAIGQHGKDGFMLMQEARWSSQSFAQKDTYDIRDFMRNLCMLSSRVGLKEVQAESERVIEAFDTAAIKSVNLGDDVVNAHGLAFWFPNSWYSFIADVETYQRLEFNKATDWTRYLHEHYSLASGHAEPPAESIAS